MACPLLLLEHEAHPDGRLGTDVSRYFYQSMLPVRA